MSPHDKLCTAISILQTHILSLDSNDIPVVLWGAMHMPSPALELAVTLLSDIVDHVEDDLPAARRT